MVKHRRNRSIRNIYLPCESSWRGRQNLRNWRIEFPTIITRTFGSTGRARYPNLIRSTRPQPSFRPKTQSVRISEIFPIRDGDRRTGGQKTHTIRVVQRINIDTVVEHGFYQTIADTNLVISSPRCCRGQLRNRCAEFPTIVARAIRSTDRARDPNLIRSTCPQPSFRHKTQGLRISEIFPIRDGDRRTGGQKTHTIRVVQRINIDTVVEHGFYQTITDTNLFFSSPRCCRGQLRNRCAEFPAIIYTPLRAANFRNDSNFVRCAGE